MKKSLLLTVSLLLCDTPAFAQRDQDEQYHKNSSLEEVSPSNPTTRQPEWQITTGMLIETENVEGSSDGKGAWEPSLYLVLAKDRWTVTGSFYQENHNTAYDYRQKGRDDWYDQYELTARYSLHDSEVWHAGLMAGIRYYRWSYHTDDKKGQHYRTLRYTLQPDWNVQITPDISSSGWLALSHFENNIHRNELTQKEAESESGLHYTVNETLGITLNYYLDRGWNQDHHQQGAFSQQELRLYLPLTFHLFAVGESRFSPYIRRSIDTWSYNSETQRKERERDTRLGLLIEQALPHNVSLSLEYAHEWQRHPDAREDQPSRTRFHYTGVGVSYLF